MCWRGHGPEYKRPYIACVRCHILKMRKRRHPDYPLKFRPLFKLNRATYESIKRRNRWTNVTVAVLSGISYSTIADYLRGTQKPEKMRQPYRATRQKAAAIAQAMRCDFSQLWSEA